MHTAGHTCTQARGAILQVQGAASLLETTMLQSHHLQTHTLAGEACIHCHAIPIRNRSHIAPAHPRRYCAVCNCAPAAVMPCRATGSVRQACPSAHCSTAGSRAPARARWGVFASAERAIDCMLQVGATAVAHYGNTWGRIQMRCSRVLLAASSMRNVPGSRNRHVRLPPAPQACPPPCPA